MPNIATAFKDEITRLARKELRQGTASLGKASTAHRADIAALKRRVDELERQVRRLLKTGPKEVSADLVTPTVNRFSGKSLASQRRRLGLSAAECGLLVGASGQSIYNWEEGKARPRDKHLPAIFALRTIGRRQVASILATLASPGA